MRIKPEYFVFAIIVLVSVCYFLGNKQLGINNKSVDHSYLIDIMPDKFSDSISARTCFVLFYVPDSDICKNMEYELNLLAGNCKDNSIYFYSINVENEIGLTERYKISGVPTILLLKNGYEYKRIMGVISSFNLKLIYERDCK